MSDVKETAVVSELAEFSSRRGFFSMEFLWSALESPTLAASTWWTGLCKHTELSKVASRILELPATSAACERSFSVQGFVHSKKRNRLSHEHTENLVFVHENLKLADNLLSVTSFKQSPANISSLPSSSSSGLPSTSHAMQNVSEPTETVLEQTAAFESSQLPLLSPPTSKRRRHTFQEEIENDTDTCSMSSSDIPYDDESDVSINDLSDTEEIANLLTL